MCISQVAYATINPKLAEAIQKRWQKMGSKQLFAERDARLGGNRESPHSWNSPIRKQWSVPGGEKLGETSRSFRGRMNEKKQLGEGKKMSLDFPQELNWKKGSGRDSGEAG